MWYPKAEGFPLGCFAWIWCLSHCLAWLWKTINFDHFEIVPLECVTEVNDAPKVHPPGSVMQQDLIPPNISPLEWHLANFKKLKVVYWIFYRPCLARKWTSALEVSEHNQTNQHNESLQHRWSSALLAQSTKVP